MKVYLVTSDRKSYLRSTLTEGVFASFNLAEKYIKDRIENSIDKYDRFNAKFERYENVWYSPGDEVIITLSERTVIE